MVSLRAFHFLGLLLVPLTSFGAAEFHYDNEITGEPEIECGYGVVHFKVHTKQGAASQIFVKGNSNNPDCVFHNTGNVTIELNKCNIRRKREVNPSGVNYAMTLILFVTKVDRAYNVNCFYLEKKQEVNIEFGVSEITTQMVANDAQVPTCKYSVHRDSPNGPVVQYSKVGEIIYHKWECPTNMYKMLLSHCKVVDGKGKEYPLIDEFGCSTDQFLFPEITYSEDVTTAMVETSAFNFPDQTSVSFTCKVRLCFNGDNCQSITPPKCKGRTHELRGITSTDSSIELAGHGDETTLGNDLNDDQLISSTIAETEEEYSTTSSITSAAPKSTEKAFEKDNEATSVSPSTSSEATSTTTTTTTTTSATTVAVTSSTASTTTKIASTAGPSTTTKVFIPSDFPRPEGLDGQDGSGETPAVDAWMVSDIPEASENRNETVESSTAPVQVLKKNKKRAPQAQKPDQPTPGPRTASRQQRDATPMPKRLVDFDIASPELTIMDDYLDTAESAGASAQKQTFRDAGQASAHSICFSPAALICAVLLVLGLCSVVVIVLVRSRKTSMTKFYGA